MDKREKVIKGLECCNPNEYRCGVCPYDDGYETCARCKPALHSDALALLKAQEARVMTLEYFDNSPDKDSNGCLVAWVEYRRDEEWAEYWEDTRDEWSVIRRDDFYSGESYRFWTSRPTDEQREATPWE